MFLEAAERAPALLPQSFAKPGWPQRCSDCLVHHSLRDHARTHPRTAQARCTSQPSTKHAQENMKSAFSFRAYANSIEREQSRASQCNLENCGSRFWMLSTCTDHSAHFTHVSWQGQQPIPEYPRGQRARRICRVCLHCPTTHASRSVQQRMLKLEARAVISRKPAIAMRFIA